jgi:two-component system sensor histidine kinase PrrB
MIGISLWSLIEAFNLKQADTKLDHETTVVQGPISRLQTPEWDLNFAIHTPYLSFSRGISPPNLPPGFSTQKLQGRMYRVNTVLGPGNQYKLALAEPLDPYLKRIDEQHRLVVLVGLAAVAAGWALGWLLGGFAVRPLRELAAATRQVASSGGIGHPPHITGAREVEAIAEAMRAMLARIREERATSDAALATARDFALLSAHELRTPLTAMRTNLEILSLHEIPSEDRGEIVSDVLRTQRRVEETLTALEHLAAHELNTDDDYADVNLNDLLDQSVVDAGRANPAVTVRLVAAAQIHIRAVRAGLRLAVENAITNAIRHGNADRVVVTLAETDQHITIAVDDNGCGIPEKQRDIVFRRFVRGSTAKGPGSGLGMALLREDVALSAVEKGEVSLWPHGRIEGKLSFIYKTTGEHLPSLVGMLSVLREHWNI